MKKRNRIVTSLLCMSLAISLNCTVMASESGTNYGTGVKDESGVVTLGGEIMQETTENGTESVNTMESESASYSDYYASETEATSEATSEVVNVESISDSEIGTVSEGIGDTSGVVGIKRLDIQLVKAAAPDETEAAESETDDNGKTEENATLTKTGDFDFIDNILDGLQNLIMGIFG